MTTYNGEVLKASPPTVAMIQAAAACVGVLETIVKHRNRPVPPKVLDIAEDAVRRFNEEFAKAGAAAVIAQARRQERK